MGWSILSASHDASTLAVSRGSQLFLWRSSTPGMILRQRLPADLTAALNKERDRDRPRGGDRERGGPRGRPGFGPPPMDWWRALAVSPRGDRLYLVDGTGGVQAWALDGPNSRSLSWSGLVGDAVSLALSPDGKLLAVGGRTGIVTLIDIDKGSVRTRLLPAPDSSDGLVGSLAFAPGGRELVVGHQQGQVELWSLADLSAPMLRLPGHRGAVAGLTFDAQGHHLAAAVSDKTVDVWNLERLREELGRLGLGW
jgi:WD40 repeat protein